VTALALPALMSALLAALFPSVAHEEVFVTGRGMTSLAGFDCRRVTSTLVDTVCLDRGHRHLLVQVRGAWRQHCGVDAEAVDTLVSAPSVGRHYLREFEGRQRCEPAALPSRA
jgi:hypothetical protein